MLTTDELGTKNSSWQVLRLLWWLATFGVFNCERLVSEANWHIAPFMDLLRKGLSVVQPVAILSWRCIANVRFHLLTSTLMFTALMVIISISLKWRKICNVGLTTNMYLIGRPNTGACSYVGHGSFLIHQNFGDWWIRFSSDYVDKFL